LSNLGSLKWAFGQLLARPNLGLDHIWEKWKKPNRYIVAQNARENVPSPLVSGL
jgi:hypothetical protein